MCHPCWSNFDILSLLLLEEAQYERLTYLRDVHTFELYCLLFMYYVVNHTFSSNSLTANDIIGIFNEGTSSQRNEVKKWEEPKANAHQLQKPNVHQRQLMQLRIL